MAAINASLILSLAVPAELMEADAMRLEFGQNDDWVVDPKDLSTRFGVSASYLKHLKTLGEVHASIEPADGTLPKVTRVKVRMLNRVWRGTFDEAGDLIHEELY